MRNVVSVYVENKFGVLTRVAALFTRRGFNIDSLTVGETDDPKYSRMTIVINGDEYTRTQVVNQLKKLYNVKKVCCMEDDSSIELELALIKVKNTPDALQQIQSLAKEFRIVIADSSNEAICVEITDQSSKINAFIDVMKPLGILEMCRTGIVSLQRGGNILEI